MMNDGYQPPIVLVLIIAILVGQPILNTFYLMPIDEA